MARSILGPPRPNVLHCTTAIYDAYALCWECTSLLNCTHYQFMNIYPKTTDCRERGLWYCPRCPRGSIADITSCNTLQDHLFVVHFVVSTLRCRLCGPRHSDHYPSVYSVSQHIRHCRNMTHEQRMQRSQTNTNGALSMGVNEFDFYLNCFDDADVAQRDEIVTRW